MNWSNVILILQREIRDQLRDRRTLFMIFVLPILLYPFMGMTFFQLAQFIKEHPTKVLVIGRSQLPDDPVLIDGDEFAKDWFALPDDARLLELEFNDALASNPKLAREAARKGIEDDDYQAALYFPPDFNQELAEFRARVTRNRNGDVPKEVPGPEVFHNSAKKKSQIAQGRIDRVLRHWREGLVRENLNAAGVPQAAARPFELVEQDIADY